jgi:DNA-binding NtrC family response regulator
MATKAAGTKTAPRVTTAPKTSILYGECDEKVLAQYAALFQNAGYAVQTAVGRKGAEQSLRGQKFDVVVLGHTLTRDDRHHLPYVARKANQDCKILVLHASGRHHEVDLAIDSRRGDRFILASLAEVLAAETVAAR